LVRNQFLVNLHLVSFRKFRLKYPTKGLIKASSFRRASVPCQPTNSGTGGKTTRLARANKEVTVVNDATLEGFRLSYGRGRSLSVILPRTMIADTKDNLIGCLAAKLLNTPGGWSKAKERMRQHLEHLTRNHGYVGAWLDCRDYQLTRVGQSYLYDVPLGKRGILAQFAGQRVRLVCTYNGQFRTWVRVGPALPL
jgi:hypothetical protein